MPSSSSISSTHLDDSDFPIDVSAMTVHVSETIYQIVENAHFVYGLISNSLLLYVIIRFSRKSLGTYKHLQMIFAAYDLFLVTSHAFLKPRVMVVETTVFGVAADWDNRYITAIYCSCNTVPFSLMIIDFLYRYWYFVGTEVLTGKDDEMRKTLLRAESRRRLGKDMHEGWLVMNHWENDEFNVRIFCALMVFGVIVVSCLSVALVVGILTHYHTYVLVVNTISSQALYLQRQLFVSLSVQTAIPLVFVYIPYICVIFFPFFKLPVFFMDDACMLLTSCFPAWNAFIVIVLMPDYWKGLMGMIRKNKPKEPDSSFFISTVASITTTTVV